MDKLRIFEALYGAQDILYWTESCLFHQDFFLQILFFLKGNAFTASKHFKVQFYMKM